MTGKLVVFEGPDGAGKTSQLGLAYDYLCRGGVKATTTRHPGGTYTGQKLRALIKDRECIAQMPGLARRLMFTVDRLTHMSVLAEMLETQDVLMDRWDGISNRAYGAVEGTSFDEIRMCEAIGVENDVPVTMALIFDVDLDVAWKRTDHEDVADSNYDLFKRVNSEYRRMAAEARETYFVSTLSGIKIPAVAIDANGTIDETHALVMRAIREL